MSFAILRHCPAQQQLWYTLPPCTFHLPTNRGFEASSSPADTTSRYAILNRFQAGVKRIGDGFWVFGNGLLFPLATWFSFFFLGERAREGRWGTAENWSPWSELGVFRRSVGFRKLFLPIMNFRPCRELTLLGGAYGACGVAHGRRQLLINSGVGGFQTTPRQKNH